MISPTHFGRFYSIDSHAGQTTQVDHRNIDFGLPHVVRAELAPNHIRFQCKLGNDWITLRTLPRPKGYAGPQNSSPPANPAPPATNSSAAPTTDPAPTPPKGQSRA